MLQPLKAKRVIAGRYQFWAKTQGLAENGDGSDVDSDDERTVGPKAQDTSSYCTSQASEVCCCSSRKLTVAKVMGVKSCWRLEGPQEWVHGDREDTGWDRASRARKAEFHADAAELAHEKRGGYGWALETRVKRAASALGKKLAQCLRRGRTRTLQLRRRQERFVRDGGPEFWHRGTSCCLGRPRNVAGVGARDPDGVGSSICAGIDMARRCGVGLDGLPKFRPWGSLARRGGAPAPRQLGAVAPDFELEARHASFILLSTGYNTTGIMTYCGAMISEAKSEKLCKVWACLICGLRLGETTPSLDGRARGQASRHAQREKKIDLKYPSGVRQRIARGKEEEAGLGRIAGNVRECMASQTRGLHVDLRAARRVGPRRILMVFGIPRMEYKEDTGAHLRRVRELIVKTLSGGELNTNILGHIAPSAIKAHFLDGDEQAALVGHQKMDEQCAGYSQQDQEQPSAKADSAVNAPQAPPLPPQEEQSAASSKNRHIPSDDETEIQPEDVQPADEEELIEPSPLDEDDTDFNLADEPNAEASNPTDTTPIDCRPKPHPWEKNAANPQKDPFDLSGRWEKHRDEQRVRLSKWQLYLANPPQRLQDDNEDEDHNDSDFQDKSGVGYDDIDPYPLPRPRPRSASYPWPLPLAVAVAALGDPAPLFVTTSRHSQSASLSVDALAACIAVVSSRPILRPVPNCPPMIRTRFRVLSWLLVPGIEPLRG
ncbi:hypothetical protein K438DRAFT_1767844 [Mycena galopus ATCC 62051]|nr:hypothetical protein K438DRAFT_1767844 [Mycena galopus ATCC 62051]